MGFGEPPQKSKVLGFEFSGSCGAKSFGEY